MTTIRNSNPPLSAIPRKRLTSRQKREREKKEREEKEREENKDRSISPQPQKKKKKKKKKKSPPPPPEYEDEDEEGEEKEKDEDEEEEEEEIQKKKKKKTKKRKKKKTKGKQKIPMKYIEDEAYRQTTFSKRKDGLMKKSFEISKLANAEILTVMISENGMIHSFATSEFAPLVENLNRASQAVFTDRKNGE
jgi:DUF4097 and DUF4098 domain-containing protein YvlB